MTTQELSMAIEAILFAAGEPVSIADLRRIFRRHLALQDAPEDDALEEADGQHAIDAAPTPDGVAADDGAMAAPTDAALGASDNEAVPVDDPIADDAVAERVAQSADAQDTLATATDDAPEGGAAQDPTTQREDLTLTAAPPSAPKSLSQQLKAALGMLRNRWDAAQSAHGFTLVDVGDAFTFRTQARFAPVLLAMREDRPARLSRPAMESLAIVAYRQPVTKPELDQLRGVDSGGTVRLLLERRLIGVVGKKDEPGRPLLYGTTPTFLSMFNLPNLAGLPSLREFNELNADSEDALRAFDGLPSLAELSSGAKQFRNDDEPSVADLDAAVARLQSTEGNTRELLLEHGVALRQGDDADARPPSGAERVPRGQDGQTGATGTLH